MRAILIDPVERTLTEIDYDNTFAGDNGAYKHIHCDCIDVVYFDSPWANVNLFVDDEGLFKPNLHFFLPLYSRSGQPIAGRALLVGPPDRKGDGTACTLSLRDAEDGIQFVDALE